MMTAEKPPTNLEEVWFDQKRFNGQIANLPLMADERYMEEWLHRYLLALHDEADELLRKTNFKVHRVKRIPLDKRALMEEAIDIFKYWASIAIALGMEPSDFYREYHRKSVVVEEKWRQEQLRVCQGKIAVFDLDGTLNEWPNAWINFLNRQLNGHMTIADMKSFYVSECLPITRESEEKLKSRFLDEVMLNGHIFPSEGAKEITSMLKLHGYTVAVATARPYSASMHYATVDWLKANGIPFDLIIWGNDKLTAIREALAPAVPTFIVEDKPSTIEKLRSREWIVYVPTWPYNKHVADETGMIVHIGKLQEIARNEGLIP